MCLSELPDDLLLDIASYLSNDSLIALSQAFRAAYVLSLNAPSWWWSDISTSHLSVIRPLSEYVASDLRSTALRARHTWNKFQTPHSKRSKFIRVPIEGDYTDVIPFGSPWLLYLINPPDVASTMLVCRDLRTGQVVGRFELPVNPNMTSTGVGSRYFGATQINHQTVLIAILSECQQRWIAPGLIIVQIEFNSSVESPFLVNTHFTIIAQIQTTFDWKPHSNQSILLPRIYHVEPGLVVWTQDIVDFGPKFTEVTPLVTAIKYQKSIDTDEVEYEIGRWSPGGAADQYTICATVTVNCFILVTNLSSPRLYGVPISTILSSDFHPGRPRHQPEVSPIILNQRRIPRATRFEFDPVVDNIAYTVVPPEVQTNASSQVYQLNMTALSNNASYNDVWFFSILLHTFLDPTNNRRVSLHLQKRWKGSSYKTYITSFGAFRSLTWCVTMDPVVALCLEKDINHWPIVRSDTGNIALVDLKSGVVCSFSGGALFTEPSPFLTISWF